MAKTKRFPRKQVIEQARVFVDKGYSELVLTGVDVTSYPFGFSQLVEDVLTKVDGLKRLRLGSIDPAGVDEKLIGLFAQSDILMPHMHLSVQSGDDTILRRMARRHRRQDVLDLANRLRQVRPDLVLGSDFITGFPTETEAMHQNTLDLVREAEIILLHVFPFSVRPSTPSAQMEMVETCVRKERARQLRECGQDLLGTYLQSQIGKKSQVLIEKDGFGLNEHYISVQMCGNAKAGQIVEVINQEVKENGLVGKV